MCFSPTVSLAAGAGLGAVGIAALLTAKREEDRPLAAVPLVLGVQQAVEGLVWSSFGDPTINAAATYGYVALAYLLWPAYVPLAVLRAEPDAVRRRRVRLCAWAGACVGLYLLPFVLTAPVSSRVVGHSIRYEVAGVRYQLPMFALYVAAVCGSCALSTHRALRVLGALLLVGLGVSSWFYYVTLFSVWCFLAAVVSLVLLLHVNRGATEGDVSSEVVSDRDRRTGLGIDDRVEDRRAVFPGQ